VFEHPTLTVYKSNS